MASESFREQFVDNLRWIGALLVFALLNVSPVLVFGGIWLLGAAYVDPVISFSVGAIAGVLMLALVGTLFDY